jgi:tetratricopeptide (TPR) repeat protein
VFMVDIIMDFFIKVYNAVGLQGLGVALVVVIAAVWISLFLRRKLNPFRRAKQQYETGNLKKAFSFLLVELEKNPQSKQALLMKADILLELGEYREAESWYYRLIDLKRPGDGIDIFEIQKRLLKPLYHQQKLLDLFNLARELLRMEKNCPSALYYLGLLYMGQLYYREAKKILDRLISVRPRMHEALFAHAVALNQLNELEGALVSLKQAVKVHEEILYNLVLAFTYYNIGNYTESGNILKAINLRFNTFGEEGQYLFALRLSAFCDMKLGRWEEAVDQFRELYDIIGERKGGLTHQKLSPEDITLYSEFGRKREIAARAGADQKCMDNSIASEYYKLKEFLIEERKDSSVPRESLASSSRFLDIEGLNSKTWAALDLGLAMVSGNMLDTAIEFFEKLKNTYPELVGLKRLIGLIRNTKKEENGKSQVSQEQRGALGARARGRGLDDYLEEWEKGGVRPYSLILIAGFSTKKQLSPLILFTRTGKFDLDF